MTIWWYVPHPVPLFWLVADSNNFCYVSLGHPTVSEKCRLHLWGQSEDFYTSTISSWVFNIPCSLRSDLFLGIYLNLFLFTPFIMLVVWMVNVNPMNFHFHIVIGAPIPILAIFGNPILWFIEYTGSKIVKSLNITLVGVLYFSVGADMGSVTYY